MPADRVLATLLRSFQSRRNPQETSQLFSTSASLLTSLSNPLNVTLLTSQILTAPAFWDRPDGLHLCLRILAIFHSACVAVLRNDDEAHSRLAISKEDWIKAVALGADDRSPRWRHVLVLGGLLLGFEGQEREDLPWTLKHNLHGGIITVINLALEDLRGRGDLEAHCIVLVLNHTFDILSPAEREGFNFDLLLPVLTSAIFTSAEGFQSGYYLSGIDADVVQNGGSKFTWSSRSTSFQQLQNMTSRPLVNSMGSLSRILAYSIGFTTDSRLVQVTLEQVGSFADSLMVQWRRNKLSEIDVSEEAMFLDEEALRKTIPILWQVLKTTMFATVTILRSITRRVLIDQILARDQRAPQIARTMLSTLRSLYFISSRLGVNAFSATTFVSLASLDILSAYPSQAQAYIEEIRPKQLGHIPEHPLDRCLDLCFLNTAEHLTLVIPPQMSNELLVAAAIPYLTSDGTSSLREMFEAAHSVMLAVFSAPQNAELTIKTVPFYIDALFQSFPLSLSPRQFRLAFKTLVRIASPPSPLAEMHPDLPSILLELINHRALHASTEMLPTIAVVKPSISLPAGPRRPSPPPVKSSTEEPALSEQAVLVLTLLDCLPFLAFPTTLEEWLPTAAELVCAVQPLPMRAICRDRFWEVISAGEMDVDRASLCVAWWGTRGGREMILNKHPLKHKENDEGHLMSGGLGGIKETSRI